MLWARVIRGRSSRANAVTFASRIFATRSSDRLAFMRATTTVPGFIQPISSGVGAWTLSTIAAEPKRAERSVWVWAPTAV